MAFAPPLASVDDLAVFMRATFDGDAEEQAYLVLQVVSAWARSVAGKNWNDSDLLPPDDVVGVVLSAARREIRNPDRVITETMGPLSVTRAKPPVGFFEPAELQILSRKSSGGLFTVSTYREEPGGDTGWLYTSGSSELFPYLAYGEPGWENTIHG